MPDYVKMSRATLGILMAQAKILAETIPTPTGSRAERGQALMNRKLMYMGQEIILDDSIPERQILAAEAPAIGENRFKASAKRIRNVSYDHKETHSGSDTGKPAIDPNKLKREIIF
jgi:hypothetical protein